MTEFDIPRGGSEEDLGFVPFGPDNLDSEKRRRIAEAELLQPDGFGNPGGDYRAVDYDGDGIPEVAELELTTQQVWDIYKEAVIEPRREAFLAETVSGQVIREHVDMVRYISPWADLVYQRSGIISLDEPTRKDPAEVARWTEHNLGFDFSVVSRAMLSAGSDEAARELVEAAAGKIDAAQYGLATVILILMAAPELQIRHEGQALTLEGESAVDWKVGHIMGDGSLIMVRYDETSGQVARRRVTAEQVLEWNNLSFVPYQASRVRPPEAG